MSVESLTVCRWSSTSCEKEVIRHPSWVEIETAIRALNNADRNDLYLSPDLGNQDTWLTVGGGNGSYVVTGSMNAEKYPVLCTALGPESKLVELCVGGQVGEYPSNYIVSLDAALSAVRKFFDAGGFDCGVSWQFA